MTTPQERTKALVWAGEFLRELASPKAVDYIPASVKQRAEGILRHYPSMADIALIAEDNERHGFVLKMLDPEALRNNSY